ncbi:hypothetical protein [Pseudomonas entomophila]|uniref:hypothetical protein n=1 Tax=Pseudomonas entomophila TaxID=312306 RepID=UPI001F030F8B|nr:hypothetical protein [Pseudomonas entomophila]MCG8294010.1 hypothetical protein [Pseudomonas entomophila]
MACIRKPLEEMNSGIVYPDWSSFGFYDLSANEPDAKVKNERPPFGVREIVGWLSDDVSGSVSAKALITRLEACELRGQPEYLGFGNAHHMAYAAGHFYLECEYSEGYQVLMTLEQAVSVLNEYVGFLHAGVRNKEVPPQPFMVEYLAEGEESYTRFEALGGGLGFSVEEVKEMSRVEQQENKRRVLVDKSRASKKS